MSEALVVLAATISAGDRRWFSEPSATSLYDRVFDVVGSEPCYIGACAGADRIAMTPKQARGLLLSGDVSDFRAVPSSDWGWYFDYCRPMLLGALPVEVATLSGMFSDRLVAAGFASSAELFFSPGIATNLTLNDLDVVALYLLERKKGRAHLDAMLRGCGSDHERIFFAVRSANDVLQAFEMRANFIRDDLGVLAKAAAAASAEASGSGAFGG